MGLSTPRMGSSVLEKETKPQSTAATWTPKTSLPGPLRVMSRSILYVNQELMP